MVVFSLIVNYGKDWLHCKAVQLSVGVAQFAHNGKSWLYKQKSFVAQASFSSQGQGISKQFAVSQSVKGHLTICIKNVTNGMASAGLCQQT